MTRSYDIFFDLRLNKRLRNNREAGDLRRYRAHFDVTVMRRMIDSTTREFDSRFREETVTRLHQATTSTNVE